MGAPDWRCVDPIEHGDIPASYVNLPEGSSWHVIPERHRTRQDELVGSSWDSLEGSSWEQKLWFSQIWYSLKLTANAPENRPGPKRKRESLPTIHVQGRSVSFREGIWCIFLLNWLCSGLFMRSALDFACCQWNNRYWYVGVSNNNATQIINFNRFNRVFHYKPSNFGGKHPYFWKHPCIIANGKAAYTTTFCHETPRPNVEPPTLR